MENEQKSMTIDKKDFENKDIELTSIKIDQLSEHPPRIHRSLTMNERLWESCCLTIHPTAALFFTQISILLIGVAFCIYKLTDTELPCPEMNAYFFLLGNLICWVKEPPKIQISKVTQLTRQDNEKVWRSCCFRIQPTAILFFTQITILLIGLVFCMYKLSDKDLECPQMNAYFFFFGGLFGWVKNSPKLGIED